jgi:hypothetical protein
MAGNFIQGAIKHPGAFTKQAKAAGKSVGEYAQEEKHAGGTTGKRARLALTLRKLAKRRKKA